MGDARSRGHMGCVRDLVVKSSGFYRELDWITLEVFSNPMIL